MQRRTLRYQLVVFDWDGTLMDSTAGIAESIRNAARDLGVPVPAREVASHVIGLGLRDSRRGADLARAPLRGVRRCVPAALRDGAGAHGAVPGRARAAGGAARERAAA